MSAAGRAELLFFDTETSGFFKQELKIDDPGQPWCVEMAAELCDAEGNAIDFFSTHVRAEGRQIGPGAQAVHGITNRMAGRGGVSEIVALGMLCGMAAQARYVVGQMIEFDRLIIESLLLRRNKDPSMWKRPGLEFLCTCKSATQFCRLVPDIPRDDAGFKWPTLDEASSILLGEPPRTDVHGAWTDMQRAKRLFFKLKTLGAFELSPTEGAA